MPPHGRLFTAIATIVLAVTMSPPTAHAASESLPLADQIRQREQEPLLKLNDRVYDLTSSTYEEHFAGAQVDTGRKTLAVYWTGDVPKELIQLRDEAAKSGVTLTLNPAKFSRRQLMATANDILPTAELGGSVELAIDGSGVTVAVGDLPAVVQGARVATAAESRLIERIAAARANGVAVTVSAARSGTAEFDATRHADISPYWAGAQIRMLGGYCTSGFSMYATGDPSARFTLTAAHCPNFSDGVAITNGAYAAMGVSDFVHELYDNNAAAYDLGVVRLNPGKTNSPSIYVAEDSSAGRIPVAGYASGGIPAGGNYCVHGLSAGGVNCYLRSGGTIRQCTGWPPAGRCVFTIAMVTNNSNYVIWCRGDSGGPVYYYSGSSAIAAGVVSWSNHEAGDCSITGGVSVVSTAVNLIPGLRVLT